MANEEQLAILRQGVEVWNQWRVQNRDIKIDLSDIHLSAVDLDGVDFHGANLGGAYLREASLVGAHLEGAILEEVNLEGASIDNANLNDAWLVGAKLVSASINRVHFTRTILRDVNFRGAFVGHTTFGFCDLSKAINLKETKHLGPSHIGTDTLLVSEGKIPEAFLRGCGLSNWEIEMTKLYNPDFSNEERNKILLKIYDLQASQARQVSQLFISYSHRDNEFVDKIEDALIGKGIRFWRDIHDMKAGRMEKQIDRAISQNPTVLLVLSEHSLQSDWVEHEVRAARGLEKEMGRDVLCPVALDDSWRSSPWEKRIMEQIMKYNILDFSAWEDDVKFEGVFRKLIDGLELFYKG